MISKKNLKISKKQIKFSNSLNEKRTKTTSKMVLLKMVLLNSLNMIFWYKKHIIRQKNIKTIFMFFNWET